MADISEYITAIEKAPTGKEVRAPLAAAIIDINEKGKDIHTLENKPIEYFATADSVRSMLPMDVLPVKNSTKLVTGNGIYAVLGNFDIDWSEDAWQPT